MAQQTLPDNDRDSEERNNPANQQYQRQFSPDYVEKGLRDREQHANSGKRSSDNLASREKTPSSGGVAGVAAGAVGGPGGKAAQFALKLRSKGGIAGIIGTILVAVLVFFGFGFFSSLGIVQFGEIADKKFDDVVAASDIRSNYIIKKRLAGVTKGCAIKVTCRYSGMSQRQIGKLRAAGITVETSRAANGFRHAKVDRLIMPDGTPVTAQNFRQTMLSNNSARSAMVKAHNPRVAAFSNKTFYGLAALLKINKKNNFSGDEENRHKQMRNTIAGINIGETGGRLTPVTDSEGNVQKDADGKTIYQDPNGNQVALTQQQADATNKAIADLNKANADIKNSAKSAFGNAAKSAVFTTATAGFGAANMMCTAYRMVETVGIGAKLVGSQQLIRFMWEILKTRDLMLAGDATAADVAYIGKKLTTDDATGKSAFESFGYNYAKDNNLALPTDKAERAQIFQFSNGGGMGGALLNIKNEINQGLGGSPDSVCGVVKNPWVQGGALIGGLALAVFTGGGSLAVGGAIAAGSATFSLWVDTLLTPYLINLAAGELVSEKTVGAEAGDAIVAGAGALNAANSQRHGLSPLTKEQAMAYDQAVKPAIAQLDEATDYGQNPLNPYIATTPAGQLARSIAPIVPRDLSQLAMVPTKVFSSFLSIFTPLSSAQNEAAQYEVCDDETYNKLNLAADPFCNIRFGAKKAALELDPQDNDEWMYNNQHITAEGEPLSEAYKEYVEKCYNRTDPIGSTSLESGGDTDRGIQCISQGSGLTQYDRFGVFYLDSIIVDYMDNEQILSVSTDSSSDSGNTGQKGWRWPADPPLNDGPCFQPGSHAGIDINSPTSDKPALAAHEGVVVQAVDGVSGGYIGHPQAAGNYVMVKTQEGIYYAYQHLRNGSLTVKVGDSVSSGQKLGIIGLTGNLSVSSSKGHLHMTVSKERTLGSRTNTSQMEDPLDYLPKPPPGGYSCY